MRGDREEQVDAHGDQFLPVQSGDLGPGAAGLRAAAGGVQVGAGDAAAVGGGVCVWMLIRACVSFFLENWIMANK